MNHVSIVRTPGPARLHQPSERDSAPGARRLPSIGLLALALAAYGCSSTSAEPVSTAQSDSSAGASEPVACSPTCNPQTGACGPLLVCSTADPCTNLVNQPITTAINEPTCATDPTSGRPLYDDGPPLTWSDTDGDVRYACVHVPPKASTSKPLPLVVFLHGSHGSADDLYDSTSLRSKADGYQVSTTAGRVGFVLVSMQGRNLHWMGPNPDGSHHDYLYRDLGSPSQNPDVRSLDHLIDTLVAGGKVDPKQIYVTGWSNGAFQSELYAIARHVKATPGGNHVAAAVAYAGADPFNTPDPTLPCQLASYPKSQVPIFLVHRSCDALVGCDQAQANAFQDPPGYAVEAWKPVLTGTGASDVNDTMVQDLIVDDTGVTVNSCAPICLEAVGALNHLRWPDGVADKGGHDHEPAMLDFMGTYSSP